MIWIALAIVLLAVVLDFVLSKVVEQLRRIADVFEERKERP